MKRIRCVIIEDELPTQQELKYLLEQYDTIEVAGCATDGDSGYALIREVQPDVVFLDISVPGMNGVEIAGNMKFIRSKPLIVFTTAYSEHAAQAFDLGAVDYLLKPYDEGRIHLALERVRARIEGAAVQTKGGVLEEGGGRLDRIPAIQSGKTVLVDVAGISHGLSEHEMIMIYSDLGIVQSLHTLQELMDKAGLFRIHKSCVVNLRRIREVYPWFNGTYQVVLDDSEKTQLTVSRSYVKALKQALGL